MNKPSILITDCLQHDFVGPIGRFDPLPNTLHIGHDESRRLLGPSTAEGPVARVIAWAHQQADSELRVVHVRDWHDPADAEQREHLEQFGSHCLRDTPGAAFVFRTDDIRPDKRVALVDATTLTNFLNTDLDAHLAAFRDRPVRVGLMGVWTEAKITFLAYDLRARYPHFQLAVCSALTASSSRANHFLALSQLERILGVRIIDSVGAFVDFLGGKLEETPLIGFNEKHPQLSFTDGTTLPPADAQLVRYLFRGCREVTARVLDGGYSGNVVLGVRSVDLHGQEEAPHVVKIGAKGPIGQERTAFERIESVLGNSAPRIVDFADTLDRGALKYRYAAFGRGQTRSLQKLYESGAPDADIFRVFDAVFVEQLGALYQAATAERSDLLEYYDFKPSWAPSVRRKVEDVAGSDGHGPEIVFLNGQRVPNITTFYESVLATLPRIPRSHYFAHVHGDLNGANVLIDGPGNVWLIDFFHSHRGHVLRDLAKLENDLLYIWTKIDSDDGLLDAMRLTDHLLAVRDLGRPLPELDAEFEHPAVARAYRAIAKLRSYYPALLQADREPTQLLIPQIRYAVHTLSFVESNVRQKRWALYTACRAAQELQRYLKLSGPLRIDWLPERYSAPGRVGLTIVPGRKDYGRSLDEDLRTIHEQQIDAVVCLLAPDEFERYGVENLLARYQESGLEVLHLPTMDRTPPSNEDLVRGTRWISERVANGQRVLLHCVGGLGRAGTLGACWMKTRGVVSAQAIREVRHTRSLRAIETTAQEEAIGAFTETRHR
ncbi:MAG TPA: isochorismatase family protein [Burkholderiales bacterium]|nr:isochorismatase family protein [Burkholderiales bacterium]